MTILTTLITILGVLTNLSTYRNFNLGKEIIDLAYILTMVNAYFSTMHQ